MGLALCCGGMVTNGFAPAPSAPIARRARRLPLFVHKSDSTFAFADLADDPGLTARSSEGIESPAGVGSAHHREHPQPEVEDVLHLVVGNTAGALDDREDPRDIPPAARHHRITVFGEDPDQVPGDPTPGDVAERMNLDAPSQLEHRGRVDDAWTEQLRAEGVSCPLPRW